MAAGEGIAITHSDPLLLGASTAVSTALVKSALSDTYSLISVSADVVRRSPTLITILPTDTGIATPEAMDGVVLSELQPQAIYDH